ncbi:hypothetical protein ACFWAT_27225 [Streptomyces syringium]|uniref:hypothetical protein n=1 Tax=Streptomyces syringium TaxID=76729 RepID=UPI00365AD59B
MRDGEGLFEAEPVEKKRPQARAAAVDKRFRAFDPHQVLLLPPSQRGGSSADELPAPQSKSLRISLSWRVG